MNLNAIRSIFTGLAGIIPLIVTFFGCTTIAGAMDCSASWVPPKYAIILGGVLGVVSFLMKAFGQGGTVAENLTKPAVVVTTIPKTGTVTIGQVNAPAGAAAPKI